MLQVDVSADGWTRHRVEVPHRPADEAFYRVEESGEAGSQESAFIKGLQAMQAFKTMDGEGLRQFLEAGFTPDVKPRVKKEILNLLEEVLNDGKPEK